MSDLLPNLIEKYKLKIRYKEFEVRLIYNNYLYIDNAIFGKVIMSSENGTIKDDTFIKEVLLFKENGQILTDFYKFKERYLNKLNALRRKLIKADASQEDILSCKGLIDFVICTEPKLYTIET